MKYMVLISLFVLFPIFSTAADTNTYGAAYDSTPPLKPISYVFDSADVEGKIFSFQGTITAICKGDGCWFKIKDDTREVLVDLKPNDFRIPLDVVGRQVKLNGRVNTGTGEIKVDAISVMVLE